MRIKNRIQSFIIISLINLFILINGGGEMMMRRGGAGGG
jgi:hypothetical protein